MEGWYFAVWCFWVLKMTPVLWGFRILREDKSEDSAPLITVHDITKRLMKPSCSTGGPEEMCRAVYKRDIHPCLDMLQEVEGPATLRVWNPTHLLRRVPVQKGMTGYVS